MTVHAHSTFTQWYNEGNLAPYVRSLKSPGGIITMMEAEQPAGDVSRPALPDLTIYQDLLGGSQVNADNGGGKFKTASEKGGFYLAAPDFANSVVIDKVHRIRALSFPLAKWQHVLDEASDGRFSSLSAKLHVGQFRTPVIESAIRNMWALCDEEGAPSRLLARAAGCEILAELCRLGGAPFTPAKGGLAPWAERRCKELMHARMAEDISLDELAAEARLSPFHFARMFKHSVGIGTGMRAP